MLLALQLLLLFLAPAALASRGPRRSTFDPRPIYHLTYDAADSGNFSDPPAFTAHANRSFMNDPNGLLVYGGRYHVFGQWGEHGHAGAAWLHAVSSDGATWTQLPPAIVAGRNGSTSGAVGTEWDAGGVYSGHAMVVDGRPVLVYCALDGKLGKRRRTVAWAQAKDPSDTLLLEWEKLEFQPWINASLHDPAVYCDPLTFQSATGDQMVGAIVRDRRSQAITSWRIDSLHSEPIPTGVVYNLGVECLCPDLAHYGNGVWGAKCLTKCTIPAGANQRQSEIGCDIFSLGTMKSNKFIPAKPLPTVADAFPVFDHGKVAGSAQTVRDEAKNRTLLWQVLGEGDCLPNQRNCSGPQPHELRSWEGVQTLPRVVWPSDACAMSVAADDCTLLVRCAPEIDKLITWRKNATVTSRSEPALITIPASEGPNNIKVHAQWPRGFAGSKDVDLAMEAFAGGPVVRIALRGGTLTVGPTWRTSAGHTPTPQVYENLTCTLSPSALAEHSVIEVFLDSSVLEVFSDTGHCAIATRVYGHHPGEGTGGDDDATSRAVTLRGEVGVMLGVYGMSAAYTDYLPPAQAS
jgi:sucrose-6-phosphate hydrolase SacC (GH32 family)